MRLVRFNAYTGQDEPTQIQAINPDYVVHVTRNNSAWTNIVVANGSYRSSYNNRLVLVNHTFDEVIALLTEEQR